MGVLVEQIRTGGDRNFGYLCADEATGAAFAVDPSFFPGVVAETATRKGWWLGYAFSTHGHSDHTNGNSEFERLTGLRVLLYGERCPLTGIAVQHGAKFPLGQSTISILHTPGHTTDSICIQAGDSLFTGDTLFVGKVGGTRSDEDAKQEYHSLYDRVMTLPAGTRVWPGHDYGVRSASTVGQEQKSNPFLLQPDVEAFIDLKANWAAYKKVHGIA